MIDNDNINQNDNHNNNIRENQNQNIRIIQNENNRINSNNNNHNHNRRQNSNNSENNFIEIYESKNLIWDFNFCKFFYFILILAFLGLSISAVGIKEKNYFFSI